MRILHLDGGREMRGGQWQVLRLIEGLASAGVESALLARAGSPLLELARGRGWRAEAISPLRVWRLARGHDLVHAHDARSHTLAAVLGRVPLVVSRRVTFPVGSRWKYGRPRYYIAVSEFVRSILVAGGVANEKISVVPDGVPLLEPARGNGVIAPANAGDRLKGAPLAVEGARRAGVELKLSSGLERDLESAAIFVYISHSEGLGSAVLLAMSAGVAVIASKTGGLAEIVRHGENGLLVDNTAESVAGAIRKLLDDPALARRLGAAGRETVTRGFTVGHMVRRTMEVYRKVLS